MALLEETAEKLAAETMDLVKKTGDNTVIDKISKAIGDTSQTLQEAFLTAIRIHTAAARGRQTIRALSRGDEVDNLDNPNI